jgi:AcrR family transcriptional regulator
MKPKAFASLLEPRKADIVMAVLRLVDKVGITGLTTKRIAKEVGFTESALYKHIQSKTDIFHLLLGSSSQMIEDNCQAIARRRLGPEESLRAWFGFVVTFLEAFPGIYRILFSDELYVVDRELFRQFKDCALDLKDRIRAVIETGVAGKVFWPDLDPDRNALMYLGVIHTTFTLWTVFEERARSYRATAKPFFEEYLRSLRIPSREVRRG